MCTQLGFMTVIRPGEATPGSILLLLFTVGDEMAYGAMPGCTQSSTGSSTSAASCDAHMLPVVGLKYHEVGSVFAVQQLCQCATDSRCDWLKLMEGAGLSLIAYTKLSRLSRCCLGF